jgi:hypothetical protein
MELVKDPHEHDLDRVHKRFKVYDESTPGTKDAVLKFMRRFAVQPIVSKELDLCVLRGIQCSCGSFKNWPPMYEHGVFFRFDHKPKIIACLVYEPKHWGDYEQSEFRDMMIEYLIPFMTETRQSEMWWPNNKAREMEPLQISIWAGRQAIARAFNVWDVEYNPYDKY